MIEIAGTQANAHDPRLDGTVRPVNRIHRVTVT
jgi:hypothetical protein